MLPFTLGILIINVPGYYLSWMAYFEVPLTLKNFGEYISESLAILPAGPLWFLWMLFMFNIIIAMIYKLKDIGMNIYEIQRGDFIQIQKDFC